MILKNFKPLYETMMLNNDVQLMIQHMKPIYYTFVRIHISVNIEIV